MVVVSAVAYSVLVGLVGVSPSMAVALGLLFVVGVLSIVYSATCNTLLQMEAREEYRGRVLALYVLLFAGSTPIGSAITGYLSDRWDVRVALIVNAAVCLIGVVVALTYLLFARSRKGTRLISSSVPPPAVVDVA
jgi:predicted MFS family arabinose efflux permease